jgi:drug/metabolite transporter (DMT)-like permease
LTLVARKRIFPINYRTLFAGTVTGCGFGIGTGLLYLALQHVEAGKLTFIIALEVVIVPVIQAMVRKQPLSLASIVAIALALIGLWLVLAANFKSFSWWYLIGLLSALSYAIYTMSLSWISPHIRIFARTFVSFCCIGLLASAMAFTFESDNPGEWTSDGLGVLSYIVLIGTVTIFVIQAWAQRVVSPSFTALMYSAEPVFVLALSYIFLGERFTSPQLFGALLILGAIILINLPNSRQAGAL